MATVQEKLSHFLQLFGDNGRQILDAANEVQKEADDQGVEFKEAAEPPVAGIDALKARKKKSSMPVDEEETAEEEAGESADDEEMEEEAAKSFKAKSKKKNPFAKAEVEEVDEEDEEVVDDEEAEKALDDDDDDELDSETSIDADEDFFPLGEVDVKEFGAMLADVMVQALNPVMTQLKELRETKTTTKEFDQHQAEGVLLAVTAAKEHEDRLGRIEAELASTRKELVHARKRLKELGDDMPKAFAGFVASESAETELPENDPRLKESGPKADPLGDFVSQFVMPNFK